MSNLIEKFDPKTILSVIEAKNLSTITPSIPFWEGFTPIYIFKLFEMNNGTLKIEGSSYVNNQVQRSLEEFEKFDPSFVNTAESHREGTGIPSSNIHYTEKPERILLQAIQSVVRFHTRVAHLFSNYQSQLYWQLRLASQTILETRENLFFNHPKYGLMHSIKHPSMFIFEKDKSLMDILDKMISKVWRFGSADCFVMHPEALWEFHRQCNKAGIKLKTKNLFGKEFTCWRDIPIIVTNKIYLNYETANKSVATYESVRYDMDREERGTTLTSVLLLRIGEEKQGVLHLIPQGVNSHPLFPGLNIEFMGLDGMAIASYLLTTYSASAITSFDALCRADILI